jgi:AcrR family transcriptional regulator
MNDDATKNRLLAEARQLFADKGFRGTSVREITRAAHANLGAITYHFRSKEALYAAVLESVFDEVASCVEQAASSPQPAADRLEAIVHALFAFFNRNPQAPRLLLHELVVTSGLPPVAQPFVRRNLTAIAGVVRDGIADRSLRPVDPILVAFTIISQIIWFAVVGRQIPAAAGLGAKDDFAREVEDHVVHVIARFLAPQG